MLENAKWICSSEDFVTVCPVFKKQINVKSGIKCARLSISAVGMYECFIGGKRVGDFIFAPGWTSYEKRLQVQEYDVTDLLEDKTDLEIYVGEGWYLGRISNNHRHSYKAKKPAVILELNVEYEDGSYDTIVSDESFVCASSGILFSGIYDGEVYDTRDVPKEWKSVSVIDYDKSVLIPTEGEEVLEFERIKPVSVTKIESGHTVVDFGQNLTGYVEFVCNAPSGTVVELFHGEILKKNGDVYTENLRTARQNIKVIANGKPTLYKPHFTYMGFRYIRVENMEVNPDDFTAVVVHSDIKRTGYFSCSNEKINKLYRNIIWSQKGNYLDVPMDCPQRDERLGWTGDSQFFMKAAAYNYDIRKFFSKWLNDMRADQYADGGIPEIIPDVLDGKGSSSAGFGDTAVVCPWVFYLFYGDKELLERQFDCMEKWVKYIKAQGDNPYLWNTGFQFGDWIAIDAKPGSYKGATSVPLISTAFFAYSTSLLIKAGKALGKNMSEYEALHENIVKAFKKEYIKDGRPITETQTAYAIIIRFGLTDTPEEYGNILSNMIVKNGNKLTTGFIGTPHLLHALNETGHTDTAYSLLLQEEYPSWLYSVNLGATTVWEHWDALREDGSLWSSDMNSFNHYSHGSVCDFMFEVVSGIKADEKAPGFENVILAPKPDKRMKWAEASFDTKYGTVKSKWLYKNDSIEYEFNVPNTATLILDGKEQKLEKGEYKFTRKI